MTSLNIWTCGDGLWWFVVTASAISTTGCFSLATESAQWRIHDGRLIVGGKSEIHEAEEVLQYLRIPLHTGLPVFVNASFQVCLGVFDLLWVWRCVVVIPGVCCDGVEVVRVCRFPPVCE